MQAIRERENIKLIKIIDDIQRSRTQAVRVCLIEKDGQRLVSLQKWWRENADQPWTEGKGFHLNRQEVERIRNDLDAILSEVDAL